MQSLSGRFRESVIYGRKSEMGYVLLLAVMGAGVLFAVCRRRRMYREIDRLLDCVLNREELCRSELLEGEFSALVGKLGRIRRMTEQQVERAGEEKEQVKSLVSDMSHQLKTPLANLSVYADILEGQELDEEKRREITGRMKRQVEKLDWIIGSLGKMVRLEQDVIAFDAEELPIRQTILDAIDAVYEKAEKRNIDIVSEPYEDVRLFHNRKWTAEVFANILENAVKYCEVGRRAISSGECRGGKDAECMPGCGKEKNGGTVRIAVHSFELYTEIQFADDGCGIRQEEIPRIFGRFYRGKDAAGVEGSGIGLYLSNLILEKEKGYMTVQSVYGEGSCFSVFLRNGVGD